MSIAGKWTYRSYLNDAGMVGDNAQRALALIFGEGVFDLFDESGGSFHGTLDMGGGYALTLTGTFDSGSGNAPATFAIVGLGIDDSPTAGWRYDYRGVTSYPWPNAVDQIPCLLGTVIRVKPHGPTAPAGVTASFVAVHQPDSPTAPRAASAGLPEE